MKIRIMGTKEENKGFINLLKLIPEITIISESKLLLNRGYDIQESMYLEIQQDTIYHSAEVVDENQYLPAMMDDSKKE